LQNDPPAYFPLQNETGNPDDMGGGYYIYGPKGRLEVQMALANEWLNLPEVRKALHVAGLTKDFSFVTDLPGYGYTQASLVKSYRTKLIPALRILQLSGDADIVVPTESSAAWIAKLGLPESRSWHPWWASKGLAVAGYEVNYATQRGFTFATVRDAGHMISMQRPWESLYALQRFLLNKPLACEAGEPCPQPQSLAMGTRDLCALTSPTCSGLQTVV